ncbi:MAG: hypothetical protein RLZZ440_1207, partial [Planctomycetota bacterium]
DGWTDQVFDVQIYVPVGVTSLTLGFGSTLDQDLRDESWGIDDFLVTEASSLPGLLAPTGTGTEDYLASTGSLANRQLIGSESRVVSQVTDQGGRQYVVVDGVRNYQVAQGLGGWLTVTGADGRSYARYARLARLTDAAEVARATAAWAALGLSDGALVDGLQATGDIVWKFTDGTTLASVWGSTTQRGLTVSGTWDQVQSYAYGRDASLVTIGSATENAAVQSLLSAAGSSTAWIGASRTSLAGGFHWTDGSSLGYTNWGANQPDNNYAPTLSENAVQIFASDGRWNDLASSNSLVGVWEADVPSLPWSAGEPNDGLGTARDQQNYLQLYATGAFDDIDGRSRPYAIVEVDSLAGPAHDLKEVFADYRYDWTSKELVVADRRQNLSFRVSTAPNEIRETQPILQQRDVVVSQSRDQLVPLSASQPIYETRSVIVGVSVTTVEDFQRSESVPFSSLQADSISITSTADLDVRGRIDGQAGTSLTAAGSLSVSGPDGGTGRIRGTALELTAGGDLAIDSNTILAGADADADLGLFHIAAGGVVSLAAAVAPAASFRLTAADFVGSPAAEPVIVAVGHDIRLGLGEPIVDVAVAAAEGSPAAIQFRPQHDPLGRLTGAELTTVGAAAGAMALDRLGGSGRLELTTPGAVRTTAASLHTGELDLVVGDFQGSAGSKLAADRSLTIHHTGGLPFVPVSGLAADSISLSLPAGGVVQIDTPAVVVAAGGHSLSVANARHEASAFEGTISSGMAALTTAGPVTVNALAGSTMCVSLTAAGDIVLDGVDLTAATTLTLVSAGSVRSDQEPGRRRLGGLVLEVAAGVDLSVDALASLTVTGGDGDVVIRVVEGGRTIVDTVATTGLVQIDAGLASLLIRDPALVGARSLMLQSASGIAISTSVTDSLRGTDRLVLRGPQIVEVTADGLPRGSADRVLELHTVSPGGEIVYWLDDYEHADAPELPLFVTRSLTLVGAAGLQFTPASFAADQADYPVERLRFAVPDASENLTPERHPYRPDSQALRDAAGRLYVRVGVDQIATHYDAAAGGYRFTVLARAADGADVGVVTVVSSAERL